MPKVFNCHEVLTRKSHICFACGREFPKRTYMERQVVQNEKEVYTIHLCSTCQELIDEKLEDGEVYYEGDFCDMALEYEKVHGRTLDE